MTGRVPTGRESSVSNLFPANNGLSTPIGEAGDLESTAPAEPWLCADEVSANVASESDLSFAAEAGESYLSG